MENNETQEENQPDTKVDLEKENEMLEKNIQLKERLAQLNQLGGKSDAGVEPKEVTHDDKINEEALRMLKGTGFEDVISPTQ